MENIPNMSPRVLIIASILIAAILVAIGVDCGDGLLSTPLDKTIASNVEIPSDSDVLFLLLEAKGTEYETRMLDQHPDTDQKGHWMQITVKVGSLLFEKFNSMSRTLTPETTTLVINMDRLEDLNYLD